MGTEYRGLGDRCYGGQFSIMDESDWQAQPAKTSSSLTLHINAVSFFLSQTIFNTAREEEMWQISVSSPFVHITYIPVECSWKCLTVGREKKRADRQCDLLHALESTQCVRLWFHGTMPCCSWKETSVFIECLLYARHSSSCWEFNDWYKSSCLQGILSCVGETSKQWEAALIYQMSKGLGVPKNCSRGERTGAHWLSVFSKESSGKLEWELGWQGTSQGWALEQPLHEHHINHSYTRTHICMHARSCMHTWRLQNKDELHSRPLRLEIQSINASPR